jgi:hypothetical protein
MPSTKSQRDYSFASPVESVDRLEEIVNGQSEFYSRHYFNKDGTPQRWRVNGKMRRWKRDRTRMYLPLMHGPYTHDAITSIEDFNTHLAVGYTEIKA